MASNSPWLPIPSWEEQCFQDLTCLPSLDSITADICSSLLCSLFTSHKAPFLLRKWPSCSVSGLCGCSRCSPPSPDGTLFTTHLHRFLLISSRPFARCCLLTRPALTPSFLRSYFPHSTHHLTCGVCLFYFLFMCSLSVCVRMPTLRVHLSSDMFSGS